MLTKAVNGSNRGGMPRSSRSWTSELSGSFHVISRIAGRELLLGDKEKEYFLLLMEKFARGFFVDIHAFCIMSNHFHILATGREQKAEMASGQELLRRYQKIYGRAEQPPPGVYDGDGTIIPDKDDGIERLRRRLGSISRFTQELKQSFSRWYNKKSGRRGYLWAERFKGVIVGQGDAQLVCSAYIDLNPIRAGIVQKPEDYRWSSMGLRARTPRRADQLLTPLPLKSVREKRGLSLYRLFVYEAGSIKKRNGGQIPEGINQEVKALMGKLKLGDKLKHRFRNLTEGQAIGSKQLIEQVQRINKRKHVKARVITDGGHLFTTRSLN